VLHPQPAHLGVHAGLAHHLLQGTDVAFGAQRIALGLHAAQALGGADQGIELGQHRFGGMRGQLLGTGQLHLVLHLALVQKRQLAKVHAHVIGRAGLAARGRGRAFGKDLQQGHGVALDQGSLVLAQQAQAVTGQIALLDVADRALFGSQRGAGDRDQLFHEHFAATHRVDHAGTENGSRTGRWLGHVGRKRRNREIRKNRFQLQSYLTSGPCA